MRDSFGGIFMIRLLLVFIVIYVAFTAISLNYAKAFRIKNKVISFIEESEITDMGYFNRGNGENLEKLDNILSDAKYNVECRNENGFIDTDPGEPLVYCYHGVIIKEIDNSQEQQDSTNRIAHYEVSTYVNWNLGALNMILALGGRNQSSENVINGSWEISGEARVVRRIIE